MKLLQMLGSARDGAQLRQVECADLVIAGWTGRDVQAVNAHIKELAKLGVRAPRSIPCYYRASVELLTTSESLQALGYDSSGEVEPVLFALQDGLWVGVGSDHTDRRVETYSVEVSKQMCQKPVASELWRFVDVAPHWDQLILRSKIRNPGQDWILYQEGTLAHIRPPEELIGRYLGATTKELPAGTVMFCGTFSAKGGIRSATEFMFEMEDPVLSRSIRHAYHVTNLERSNDTDAD